MVIQPPPPSYLVAKVEEEADIDEAGHEDAASPSALARWRVWCPPQGRTAEVMTYSVILLTLWAVSYCVLGKVALPGHHHHHHHQHHHRHHRHRHYRYRHHQHHHCHHHHCHHNHHHQFQCNWLNCAASLIFNLQLEELTRVNKLISDDIYTIQATLWKRPR